MKMAKKILSLSFAFILAFSCFGMILVSANSELDANTTDIEIDVPYVGDYPDYSVSLSNDLIRIVDITWAYCADGGAYHIMSSSDTFKSGYTYRVYIDYAPNYDYGMIVSTTTVTVNGNPTTRSDVYFADVYYYFGSPKSSFFNIFEFIFWPFEILLYPFKVLFGF